MIERRTSGAKTLVDHLLYGTAEPVPFVQSIFGSLVQQGAERESHLWALPSSVQLKNAAHQTTSITRCETGNGRLFLRRMPDELLKVIDEHDVAGRSANL